MKPVTTGEGIAYGINLIGYAFGLCIVIWLSTLLTYASINDGNIWFGFFVAVIGLLIIIAGFLGIIYKVISDAVQNGILKAQ